MGNVGKVVWRGDKNCSFPLENHHHHHHETRNWVKVSLPLDDREAGGICVIIICCRRVTKLICIRNYNGEAACVVIGAHW